MTLNAKVVRQKFADFGTPGVWAFEDSWRCDTLELPWANNERGRSCILPETYRAVLWESPHLGSPNHRMVKRADGTEFDLFHKVYRLEDKNGRVDVLVHNANFAGEVRLGKETQLHGCTAVGHDYGDLRNHAGAMQRGILHSVATLEELIEHARGEDLLIAYEWAEGCAP